MGSLRAGGGEPRFPHYFGGQSKQPLCSPWLREGGEAAPGRGSCCRRRGPGQTPREGGRGGPSLNAAGLRQVTVSPPQAPPRYLGRGGGGGRLCFCHCRGLGCVCDAGRAVAAAPPQTSRPSPASRGRGHVSRALPLPPPGREGEEKSAGRGPLASGGAGLCPFLPGDQTGDPRRSAGAEVGPDVGLLEEDPLPPRSPPLTANWVDKAHFLQKVYSGRLTCGTSKAAETAERRSWAAWRWGPSPANSGQRRLSAFKHSQPHRMPAPLFSPPPPPVGSDPEAMCPPRFSSTAQLVANRGSVPRWQGQPWAIGTLSIAKRSEW